MRRTLTASILLLEFTQSTLGATECGAGKKLKKDLTNLFCTANVNSVTYCDNNCCVDDDTTCGGLAAGGETCPFDSYAEGSDAWKSTAATKATYKTICCRPKVTCSNTFFTCPGGYKRKTSATIATTKCASDAASCAVISSQAALNCCEPNPLTCKGRKEVTTPTNPATWNCPAGQYNEYATGAPQAKHEAWNKIKPTLSAGATTLGQTDWQNGCCAAKLTCNDILCPAGYKARTGAGANTPASATNVFTSNEITGAGGCCEFNTDLCGGRATSPTCTNGYYPSTSDTWKNKKCNGDCNTHCCAPKATCAATTCPAGYKMKKNVEKTVCTSDHESCHSDCCEKNTVTCGGLTGIVCKYGTFDERSTWTKTTTKAVKDAWNNKPATDKTKNTDCCTAAAACSANAGTTTPGPAATTTPAAPARRLVNV